MGSRDRRDLVTLIILVQAEQRAKAILEHHFLLEEGVNVRQTPRLGCPR